MTAAPKSHMSGVTLRGISSLGGGLRPPSDAPRTLPRARRCLPPELRLRRQSRRTKREADRACSLEHSDELLEDFPAMLVVVEHVEGGAGGREEDDVAGAGLGAGGVDGGGHARRRAHGNAGGGQGGGNLGAVLAEGDRVAHA